MPRPPFPHMMPGDVPLFASFVLTPEARRFTRWEFDAHLGQGHLTAAEFNLPIYNLSLEVSRLRVDAIGWDHGVPTLFEVKPQARLSAFGQIMAYRFFYRLERQLEAHMAIITDSITPDTALLFASHGITVHIVQEAEHDEIVAACAIVQRDCSQLIRIPTLA